MVRALEHDFKEVVGISWYLWLFVILFLLLNINGNSHKPMKTGVPIFLFGSRSLHHIKYLPSYTDPRKDTF
jgi:hypothetical protein